MKYILHVGTYDFDIKNTSTVTGIAEVLKDCFVPDKYHDEIDITVELKKEDE